jgi:hypothetical protein
MNGGARKPNAMRVRVFEYEGRVLRLLIRDDGAVGALLNELAAFLAYNDAKQALKDHVTKPGWKCTLTQFEEGVRETPSSDSSRGRLATSGEPGARWLRRGAS